jgi:hypothetical protein
LPPECSKDILGRHFALDACGQAIDRIIIPEDREDARRVFVNHAARETLSATLMPSTAAGGADGRAVHGLTSRDRGGDQRLLDAVQIVELELNQC